MVIVYGRDTKDIPDVLVLGFVWTQEVVSESESLMKYRYVYPTVVSLVTRHLRLYDTTGPRTCLPFVSHVRRHINVKEYECISVVSSFCFISPP